MADTIGTRFPEKFELHQVAHGHQVRENAWFGWRQKKFEAEYLRRNKAEKSQKRATSGLNNCDHVRLVTYAIEKYNV